MTDPLATQHLALLMVVSLDIKGLNLWFCDDLTNIVTVRGINTS